MNTDTARFKIEALLTTTDVESANLFSDTLNTVWIVQDTSVKQTGTILSVIVTLIAPEFEVTAQAPIITRALKSAKVPTDLASIRKTRYTH